MEKQKNFFSGFPLSCCVQYYIIPCTVPKATERKTRLPPSSHSADIIRIGGVLSCSQKRRRRPQPQPMPPPSSPIPIAHGLCSAQQKRKVKELSVQYTFHKKIASMLLRSVRALTGFTYLCFLHRRAILSFVRSIAKGP